MHLFPPNKFWGSSFFYRMSKQSCAAEFIQIVGRAPSYLSRLCQLPKISYVTHPKILNIGFRLRASICALDTSLGKVLFSLTNVSHVPRKYASFDPASENIMSINNGTTLAFPRCTSVSSNSRMREFQEKSGLKTSLLVTISQQMWLMYPKDTWICFVNTLSEGSYI